MMPYLILAIVFIIIFLLGLLMKTFPNKPDYKISNNDFYLKHSILTDNEMKFYRVLEIALQNRYLICPKVNLYDFVKHNNNSNFNRIRSKHCDFLICNSDLKPLCGIELDDNTHLNQKASKNDNFKNELFKTIGLKLVRIKVSNSYNPLEIREKIISS